MEISRSENLNISAIETGTSPEVILFRKTSPRENLTENFHRNEISDDAKSFAAAGKNCAPKFHFIFESSLKSSTFQF